MKKAGIIGGSGFIGSYITQTFLNNGFSVKVSVTDISRKDKYRHLYALGRSENLNITEVNVINKTALQDFVSGCDIIVHGGTPFQLDVEDPDAELFEPTVKGTKIFLDVIQNTPGIEKVVFIASVAAYNTNFPLLPDGKTAIDTIDEDDVKFISNQSHPYGQAKFIAGQTVEKFIGQSPDLSFEISSVSPVMVFGKSLSGRQDSTSTGLQFLLKNKIAPNPFIQFLYDNDAPLAIVDVRDVASAVYKAAITKGLHGKNYLLSSETYPLSDVNLMLNGLEPKKAPAIVYKNILAKSELNATFRPVKKTLDNYNSQ